MYLCYYDESGDDGFPTFASPFFIFTAIYLHHLNWKESYQIIHDFRKEITKDYGLPVKIEMHTKHFLLAKNPYKGYAYSVQDRLEIISKFCRLIAKLNIKVINTCIVKPPAGSKKSILYLQNSIRVHTDRK